MAAAGCGGEADAPHAVPPPPSAWTASAPDESRRALPPQPACDDLRPLRTRAVAFGAVVRARAVVFDRPHGSRRLELGHLNVNGVPTVLGVLARTDCGEPWYRVQLPVRPNGVTGWVRAADVDLVRVRTRIDVDLGSRRLTLLRDGRPLLEAVITSGAPGTPTPTGHYYVNQKLVAPDPSGPFGPAALGISAFSPTLIHWTQGGPIAIHGTNRPELLGAAASNGCIRIRNDVLARLYRLAPTGTPVTVRA